MLADSIAGAIAAPFLPKLFLAVAALAAVRAADKGDAEEASPWAFAGLAAAVVRDILAFLLPGLPLFPFDDLLLAAFAVGAVSWKSARWPLGAYAAAAAAAAGIAASGLLGAEAARWAPPAAVAAGALLVAVAGFRATRPEGGRSASVLGSVALAVGIIAPAAISAAFPGSAAVRHGLALPLSYLGYAVAAVEYGRRLQREILLDRDYLSDTIDTLYKFVLNASDSLKAGADLGKLMGYAAQTVKDETGADGALVLMVDDFDDVVGAQALCGDLSPVFPLPEDFPRSGPRFDAHVRALKVKIGEGFVGTVAQGGKAAFLRDASVPGPLDPDPVAPASSVIAVPLLIQDRVIGEVVATKKKGSQPFADADFDRASLLADFASLVINNVYSFQEVAEKSDIDTAATIAADIQKALRPKRLPQLQGAAFGAFSVPARGVCGDYYDVIVARRDRVYLVMGDVAGKGVPASLIMVMIRAILHLVTNTPKDASTILSWINRGITGKIDIDHFATLQIVVYNPADGTCEYANAGHRPPLLWRKSTGLVDTVEAQSVPIGVEKATEFDSVRFSLEDGDILLLYTDGLVETINSAGKQYGVKSLTTMLHKFNELPPGEIADKINVDVHAFGGNVRQHDDQTLLVMKAKS